MAKVFITGRTPEWTGDTRMTKADELWEKYSDDTGYKRRKMCEAGFLAALKEYGEAVRKRDAEIAKFQGSPTLTIGMAGAQSFANRIAAAIEREPLP